MKQTLRLALTFCLLAFIAGDAAAQRIVRKSFARAERQTALLDSLLTSPDLFPASWNTDGTIKTNSARGWISGFFPGNIWYLYEYTGDAKWLEAARRRSRPDEQSLLQLDAFSLAAAEENAAGHLVVTAPTSGSAGLLPGVIEYLRRSRRIGDETLCDGLLVAALVAFVARHNASISGAEVGCQGEIGVASAMAAALLAAVKARIQEVK